MRLALLKETVLRFRLCRKQNIVIGKNVYIYFGLVLKFDCTLKVSVNLLFKSRKMATTFPLKFKEFRESSI